jgi:N-acetyl sugar amidotransferase
MKNSLCKPFQYEIAVLIDAEDGIYPALTNFIKAFPKNQLLSVTYNHRFYDIHHKNLIKAYIDSFDIDHLMFSIRPSSMDLIKRTKDIDVMKFKSFVQIAFVLQSMARYEIEKGVIFSKYLPSELKLENDALAIGHYINSYLEELEINVKASFQDVNFNKSFCSLTSLSSILASLKDKKILFYEDFISDDIPPLESKFIFEYQISELEKDIFWLGFDSDFKEVPWSKEYLDTKWNLITHNAKVGEGLYESRLRYCSRCCMPETMEGIAFDEFGICTPCRSSEEKMHINWEERDKILTDLIKNNRSLNYYDCSLPMSGGKDSTFQAYILTHKYGLTPLAVTHGANWMSLSGRYNLENCLQKFDLDHIIFHSKRSTINKAARKSLTAIGDACWHCHIGAGTFVIQTALNWNLELLIWGESIAERDGRGSYINQTEASLYYNLEVSGKIRAEDYSGEGLDDKELSKWFYPEKDRLLKSKIRYLHLGDYMFWDEEKQVEFIVKHFEWMNSKVENAFKGYKSNECVMAGVHDYANFIKRGIGRATVQASDDIRRGILTREEGIELAKKYDSQRPHALDYYLKLTGYSESEFEKILIEARSLSNDAKKLNF